MYTIEELDALAIIDPEIDGTLKLGQVPRSPEINFADVEKATDKVRLFAESWGSFQEREGITCTKTSYPTRDGHENRFLVFGPTTQPADQRLPLIVHVHGGGGCVGGPESTADFCQDLVQQLQCMVITISYRLAPEHKFPIGRNDIADAVKYISIQASEYGADLSLGFVLGGHSYGASASAVMSLHAEKIGIQVPITGLYLGAGSYIGKDIPSGYEQCLRSRTDERCLDSPVLDRQTAAFFSQSYAGDPRSEWWKACQLKPPGTFEGQPRAYFQVCGMDILRDDSLIYQDILLKNGVDTRIDVYPGAPHLFWNMFKPGTTKQSDTWLANTTAGYKWLLRKTQVDNDDGIITESKFGHVHC